MTRIGEAIRHERQARGLSLRAVAEPAGISFVYLSEIERGMKLPTHPVVLRIANEFPDADAVGWAWLLTEDLFGAATVEIMRKHAVALAARDGREG